MSSSSFTRFYDFIEQPDNDGQPFHITEGDPGGATVHGWTYEMWQRVAPMHGVRDVSLASFKAQNKQTLLPLMRAQYWNTVQADQMPVGIDLFWSDFQFGSGEATKVLQAALGVQADGVVGTEETLPALAGFAFQGLTGRLLDNFLVARCGYYDRCGFATRWPGLYRRARASHALARSMGVPPVPASGHG